MRGAEHGLNCSIPGVCGGRSGMGTIQPAFEGDLPGFREFELSACENPDWAGARTPRTAILAPSGEWVQSVYSCEFDLNGRKFIAPNRDYAYEGLLFHSHGENWKFIDCLAFNLRTRDGRQIG